MGLRGWSLRLVSVVISADLQGTGNVGLFITLTPATGRRVELAKDVGANAKTILWISMDVFQEFGFRESR